MKRLLKEVQRSLGVPVMLEIERKYLLQEHFSIQNIPVPYQRISIEQAYLKKEGERPRQRIRCRGQNDYCVYYLTEKTPSTGLPQVVRPSSPQVGFAREEKEKRIRGKTYYELMKDIDPQRELIKKERICFLWKNQYFELDLFLGPKWLKGMMLLEIELTEENDKVEIPNWLGKIKEVTDNPRYENSSLSKEPPQ